MPASPARAGARERTKRTDARAGDVRSWYEIQSMLCEESHRGHQYGNPGLCLGKFLTTSDLISGSMHKKNPTPNNNPIMHIAISKDVSARNIPYAVARMTA